MTSGDEQRKFLARLAPDRPSFDIAEVYGLPVAEAEARFRAERFQVRIAHLDSGLPTYFTLDRRPRRVSLLCRNGRVVDVRQG